MKKILVTGGAGFIGSHLCESLLALGYQVVNVDSFNDYYDPSIKWMNVTKAWGHSGYNLIVADIRDVEAMEEIFGFHHFDAVVHLAALAGVRSSINNPLEYADVDITGTINLLECSKKYGVSKFVLASSSSVYGNHPTPFSEADAVGAQLSPYAAAKLAAEQFCRVYHELYKLPVVCLRFFTVYGERQRPEMAIYKLTRQIDRDEVINIYGDGNSFRDYTYVGDTINGIAKAIGLPCGFEIINLGSGNKIRLMELVDMIGDKLNRDPKVIFIDMQQGDVPGTNADIRKAEMLMGYHPQMDFSHGLDRFLSWYDEQKGNRQQ